MDRWLGRYEGLIYAALRIVIGFLFLCHGLQKVFGLLGGERQELVSLMGLAGIIELAGGTLVALGLYASWAAFICSGQMAFAYFMAHAHRDLLPIANGGEPAVFYCFAFLYIAARGNGPFSLGKGRARKG